MLTGLPFQPFTLLMVPLLRFLYTFLDIKHFLILYA